LKWVTCRSVRTLLGFHTYLLLFLGFSVSLLVGHRLYQYETDAALLHFKNDVSDKAILIEREIISNIEALYSLESFFNNSDEVTPIEFRAYSQSILARHKNIQALEWAPRVTHEQRQTGYLDQFVDVPSAFEITERDNSGVMVVAKEREEYFPVVYLEPYVTNEAAFGFDLASSSARKASLTTARKTGRPIASATLDLVQGKSSRGFLVCIPLFDGIPTTQETRASSLTGYVVGVFRISDIVSDALRLGSSQGIDINLYDVTGGDRIEFGGSSDMYLTIQESSDAVYVQRFEPMLSRQWIIEARPSNHYLSKHRTYLPFYVSIVSMMIFVISIFYFIHLLHVSSKLKEAQVSLEALASRDSLTGVGNRRAFDQRLAQEWSRAIRNQASIGLLMIDVDHFKGVNDTYGHQVGDRCLATVADTLNSVIRRDADFVARYGGDEFALILPDTDNVDCVAEQCRRAVENVDMSGCVGSAGVRITVSVGCAIMRPTRTSCQSELIALADEALFSAKDEGRNCCRGGDL